MDLPSTLLVPLSAPGISPRTLPGGRCAQGRLPSPADVPRPDNSHPETLTHQPLRKHKRSVTLLLPLEGCILSLLASFLSPPPTKRAFHIKDSGSESTLSGWPLSPVALPRMPLCPSQKQERPSSLIRGHLLRY